MSRRDLYTDWRLLLVGFHYEDKDGRQFQVMKPVMSNPPYFMVTYGLGDGQDQVENGVIEDNSSGPWTMIG